MPTPFSSQDLGRVFDARALTRGRTLVLSGGVEVRLDGDTIAGTVQDAAGRHTVRITPSPLGRRVVFDSRCGCGATGCAHLAAAAFAALDRFPALRRPEQQSFLDALVATPEAAPDKELQRTAFELAPGEPPYACVVTTLLIGERSGTIAPTTPRQIAADTQAAEPFRALARLLGGQDQSRTGVPAALVDAVLRELVRSGQARWHAGGRRLVPGEMRVFASTSAASLPPRSGVILGNTGPWYVDAASGAVGRIRVQPPVLARPPARPPIAAPRRRPEPPAAEQVIVERPLTPVLRLTRFPCPDDLGRMQELDALLLEFDYDGAVIPVEDDRQFVRVEGPAGPVFVRRDRPAEAAILDVLRQDGFVQMRMAQGQAAKGRLVFVFRGRDAAESWQGFVAERLPALQSVGWRSLIDPGFGPRLVGAVGACDMRLADAAHGGFSLDLGIEIDGVRHPLLPILVRLRERGGLAAARIVDGQLVTSLETAALSCRPSASGACWR